MKNLSKKTLKFEEKKTKKLKKEVEKSEFYWFGLVYKFKNPTQMVWLDI